MEANGVGGFIMGAVVRGATSGLVTKYVDKVVNPFLRGIASAKVQATIKKNIFRYIKGVEYRTRTLPSIAIPSGVFQLEEVYEPLSVKSESDGFTHLISDFPRELFEGNRCVALTDDAGMGKSTLAKFIVRTALNESKSIPLLIELRRMRSGASILDLLCTDLAHGSSDSEAGQELITLFSSGNFLFVFDGYDELEEDVRGNVTDEINALAAKFQFCYFLLTSRKEYGSALFPEFAHFEICKLTEEQAYSLIRRYDQGRGIAKALIAKIEDANIEEFLGNPLLVTLLYRAFDYRPMVPVKRTTFFRQVYEAIFQDHDLSKGGNFERKKQSSLDVDDFHKFVRALGFITFRAGRVSYSPEEFCANLQAAAQRSGLNVEWQKVKSDLVRAVPLFFRDGIEFRWCHKAFQEYFAAQYIAMDLASKREEALKLIFASDELIRFREVLRFIAEVDIALVRDVCIEPFLGALRAKFGGEAFELPIRTILAATDIYYIGTFERVTSEGRMTPQKVVATSLGADTSKRLTRSVVNAKGFAMHMALNSDGVKLLLLPALDPENFSLGRRDLDVTRYRYWLQRFGQDQVLHVNSEIDGEFSDEILSALVAATRLPRVTSEVYERILEAQQQRGESLKLALLDAF